MFRSLWAHKTTPRPLSFAPSTQVLRNTVWAAVGQTPPAAAPYLPLARSLFSSELKTKQTTQNLSSTESQGAVCLVSSGVAQQGQEAGDGRACLWGLPEAFSVTVLAVIVLLTLAARCWGSALAPVPMSGGGTVPMFTHTFCYSPAPNSPLQPLP